MDNTPQFQGQNSWNPPPPPFPQPPPPLPPQQKQSGGSKTCLIILLVVLAVVAVPIVVFLVVGASVASPMYMKGIKKAKISTAASQIKLLDQALDNYKLDVGTYPSDLQGLVMNIDQSEKWNGPYLKVVPMDPWGYEYQYYYPGEHGVFDLYSLGADGQEGGEGENADITNWW